MGADPNTGRFHLLTDEFLQQRPEAQSWTKFHVGQVVTVAGMQFYVKEIRADSLLLRTAVAENAERDRG